MCCIKPMSYKMLKRWGWGLINSTILIVEELKYFKRVVLKFGQSDKMGLPLRTHVAAYGKVFSKEELSVRQYL